MSNHYRNFLFLNKMSPTTGIISILLLFLLLSCSPIISQDTTGTTSEEIPTTTGSTGHTGEQPGGHTEGASHGESGSHFNWFRFLSQVGNSLILFGGLFLLLRKPLSKYLGDETLNIRVDLEEREENHIKKTQELQQISTRLDKIEEEIRQLKELALQIGSEEKNKLEALAQQEASRIIRLNSEEINQRIETAIRQFKERIADVTIERFKKDFESWASRDTKILAGIQVQNVTTISELNETKK